MSSDKRDVPDTKIQRIEVDFPISVELDDGFEQILIMLVDTMVCRPYEKANPTRVMWPAGQGSKPNMAAIHREDHGNMFDHSVFHIGVAERGADTKTLKRRGFQVIDDTECPDCSEIQFVPKNAPEPNMYTCVEGHLYDYANKVPPKDVVHFLMTGKALCDFMVEVLPDGWPPQHKWSHNIKDVNCGKCTRRFRHVFAPTGTFCSVCDQPQHDSPGGITCPNGHGGADSRSSDH